MKRRRDWRHDAAETMAGENVEPLRTLGIPEWAIGDLRRLGLPSGKNACTLARDVLTGALWDFRQEKRREAR